MDLFVSEPEKPAAALGCATSTAISIAVLAFEETSRRLSVASEVDVELYDDNAECLASEFPFEYPSEEQVELMVYRHTMARSCRTGCMTLYRPDRSSAP
jgi:hypothetical protein